MPSVPREKYPEMNWRAADKVAAWKVFKRRMEVIFMADQIPEERQWALILMAGGDEAYNRWDTLEDTVQDRKKVEQVWKAFEKSFEQSTSFWHFRDTYLADFRQDESETTADLDLHIKQTVRGCQWQKESKQERMIDLLYHATIYYEIRKFVQESDPNALTYEMVIEKAKAHEHNVLEYKDHQASHGGANSAPSYNNPLLSAHALSKRRPSGHGNNGQRCGKCGKSHERGNCPAYGKTCNRCQGINHFKAVCRSKVCSQDGTEPSPKQEVTATSTWFHGELQWPGQRRWQPSTPEEEDPKEATEAECVCSDDEKLGPIRSNNYILVARERNRVMYHQRRSFQDRRRKVLTRGFLALQFIVKCLKAPMLRVSPRRGCILTQIQTIGLRSLQT